MTWSRVFDDLPREHDFEPLRTEGVLPAELRGTIYRCGPASMSCRGRRYAHPFDGDGAVTAVRFAGGAAWGASRLVETPGLVAERRADRPLYPAYGTLPPGPPQRMPRPKNAANISTMMWNDRLFALHESGPPIEFEATALRTIGEADLGATDLRDGFSAHPHRVPGRGLFNFSVRYGAQTTLQLFELRGDGARVLGTVPLAGATMIHDFAATERYLIFFASPLRLRIAAFAAGRAAYGDALDWQPQHGTEVLIVPIDDPAAVTRLSADAFFQWHFANAFERGSEIVVDVVRYPDFSTNRWLASLPTGDPLHDVRHGTLARAIMDPTAKQFRIETVAERSIEFPRVAPAVEGRPHRFVYAVAHSSARMGLHDQIVRIDVETGAVVAVSCGADSYPSEPIFIPRGTAPDDGWLATLVYDAATHTSHVAMFDAAHLERGPIARTWFDHHIPFTFHGMWMCA